MSNNGVKSFSALGFLTVVEDESDHLFGGYLVLNPVGRPLEFHCTAPIKPNRAQEIIYGPTLRPYLFGEQIGQALLKKSSIKPAMICTDREPVLAVQDHTDLAVVLVLENGPSEPPPEVVGGRDFPTSRELNAKVWRGDGPHALGKGLTSFEIGRNRLAVPEPAEANRQEIVNRLGDLAESFDLAEPFGRIREAIEEARQGGRVAG